MKIAPRHTDRFLKSPDPEIIAVLLYGPDRGLVRERAETLIGVIIDTPDDPFRLSELTPASLRQDPTILVDEAAALSFSEGRRVIRIRDATDGLTKTLEAFVSDPKGDSFVIVEAGELSPRSSLRKLFEQAEQTASLACYTDDDRQLSRVIEQTLGQHGMTIAPDARDYLVEQLGSDRMVTRNELEKLAVYVDQKGDITLDDARACIGDSAGVSLDAVVYAVGEGNFSALETALRRVLTEGIQPIQILRAMARHLQRLQLAAGYVQQGQSPEQAVKALRPPVMFMFVDRFRHQLSLWPVSRLSDAVDLILETELSCKTTGMPAELLCHRTLLRLTQGANAMSRRAVA